MDTYTFARVARTSVSTVVRLGGPTWSHRHVTVDDPAKRRVVETMEISMCVPAVLRLCKFYGSFLCTPDAVNLNNKGDVVNQTSGFRMLKYLLLMTSFWFSCKSPFNFGSHSLSFPVPFPICFWDPHQTVTETEALAAYDRVNMCACGAALVPAPPTNELFSLPSPTTKERLFSLSMSTAGHEERHECMCDAETMLLTPP